MAFDESTLRARVLARPAADEPRLAYAEALEARGEVTGTFVRTSLELARLASDVGVWETELETRARLFARWAEANGPSHERFVARVGDRRITPVFRRGFVEGLDVPDPSVLYGALERLGDDLRLVRHLTIRAGLVDEVISLLGMFRDVVSLELGGNVLSSPGLAEMLFSSDPMARLRRLVVGRGSRIEGATRALAKRALPRLETLDLSCSGIGDVGAKALAQARWTKSLRGLRMTDAVLGPDGIGALVAAPHGWDRLSTLDLGGNPLGGEGVTRLRPLRAPLVVVSLPAVEADSESLKRLLEGRTFAARRLSRLSIDFAPIGDSLAEVIGKKSRTLRSLSASSCSVGEKGVVALLDLLEQSDPEPTSAGERAARKVKTKASAEGAGPASKRWNVSPLQALDLSANPLGSLGLEHLADSYWAEKLVSLDVAFVPNANQASKLYLSRSLGARVRFGRDELASREAREADELPAAAFLDADAFAAFDD